MKNFFNTIFVLVITIQFSYAQDAKTKNADKHFDRLEFVEAIKDYEKLVTKGKADAYVYNRLAKAYFNISNSSESAKYYKLYLETADNAPADDYQKYAQILMSTENYEEAMKAYQDFANKAPNDLRAKAYRANPNFVMDIKDMNPNYNATVLDINSEYSDFGGYESNDNLYFVSSRNKSRKTYGWNDQPTLDIYVAENVGDTFKNEKALKGDINSKYNEGTIVFTNDGKTAYFTRINYVDGDYEVSESGISNLKIYRATKVNEEWKDITALPFTSSEYSVGHPALSPDESTLYFSSDMDGGYGLSDIYKVDINEDGSFGSPMNLGPMVNTEGRESFPFVDADGKLFFASDGQLGLGGLDVFYTSNKGGKYNTPTNLGMPINSSKDDFAFTYFNAVDRGYLSSNRGGNSLDDNIYQVQLIRPLEETTLIVKVLNADTNAPLSNAEVLIYDEDDKQMTMLKTDAMGNAKYVVLSNLEYDIQGNLLEHESDSKTIMAKGDSMQIDLKLKPIEKLIVDREIVLPSVFFAFDKADIKPEAAYELDKLAETLKKYDDVDIKIESYTDSRGSDQYNKTLSQKRAESTLQYLVDKGVDASRLTAVGMGEANPVVDCASGCTEEQHEQNRRSKFIIVE